MQRAAFKLFVEVAELGSLSKVAVLRNTVQSNVSRQLAELEKTCGGRLFQRTGRGVTLTELGERIMPRVRSWLIETDQLMSDIKTTAGMPIGEVRIGILPSTAHPLITTLYDRLRERFPDIRLSVREGMGAEVDAWIDNGRVDLAIVFRNARVAGNDEKCLATINTYLVSGITDPLTRGATVECAALHQLPLILPCRPSRWRDVLDDMFRRKGIAFGTIMEADSLTIQREVAARGTFYAVLGPYAIAQDVRAGKLQASRLAHPNLKRFVTLATAKHGPLTPAARIVSKLIQEISVELGTQGLFSDTDIGVP